MTSRPALAALAVLAAAAVGLGGCISLLPKTEPSQLYRFDGPRAPAPAEPAAQRFNVLRANSTFTRDAAGDRILTLNGAEAAYIAEARWVAPAVALFDAALAQAFDTNSGPARLVQRGENSKVDYILRADVRAFEARYESGLKAAPTVLVRVRATLSQPRDQALAGERIFEARVRASDNRVGAIVEAYDEAVDQALTEIVAWTNESGVPTPPAPPAASPR